MEGAHISACNLGFAQPVTNFSGVYGQGKKPRGYWDRLVNVQREVDEFGTAQGLPPGVMPQKAELTRAGRYDLAHAVERWGGLYGLAELLDYQVGAGPVCSDSLIVTLCTKTVIAAKKQVVAPAVATS